MAAQQWVLLGRVLRVAPGLEDGEVESAPADAADFSFEPAVPPRVTVITANLGAQPVPESPDHYPYVLVANPVGLLVHFSVQPFIGVQFGSVQRFIGVQFGSSVLPPHSPNLVLLRKFHDPEPELEAGVVKATAHRIPPRHGSDPIIWNIDSICIAMCDLVLDGDAVTEIIVAELMVDTGRQSARIIYCFADGPDMWFEEERGYPLAAHDRDWVPAGVVLHHERFWWFDLSWGILSCEADPDEMGHLLFHHLPEGRALDASPPLPDIIHDHRCITVSGNALRYVEIITIIPADDQGEAAAAATVCMWTAIPNNPDEDGGDGTIVWEMAYEMSFAEIWNDRSYVQTWMPQMIPVITAVCPSNPNLVYFSLEQERRIFGVDVPQHRVVDFVHEPYDLVMPWQAPPSSRYVLAWYALLQLQVDDADEDLMEEGSE